MSLREKEALLYWKVMQDRRSALQNGRVDCLDSTLIDLDAVVRHTEWPLLRTYCINELMHQPDLEATVVS